MGEKSLITDEIRSKIGVEAEPLVCEITEGMIRRFVLAVGDSNPLWQKVAPPAFIPTIGYEQCLQQMESLVGAGGIHGSTELECYRSVRAGDTITVIIKIADVRERQSTAMGKMVFVTFDITYQNQNHEPVARCRQKIIGY